jgi:hypothetical protein
MKDFKGYRIFSTSSCVEPYNRMEINRTIRKAFPNDYESSLYIVKVKGIRGNLELYENEMYC